ncbi:hypothetical protein EGT09_09120 [Pseudomonas putida]|nr:hypothetical protein EGT09_09120 [Pseudomonas putida]
MLKNLRPAQSRWEQLSCSKPKGQPNPLWERACPANTGVARARQRGVFFAGKPAPTRTAFGFTPVVRSCTEAIPHPARGCLFLASH